MRIKYNKIFKKDNKIKEKIILTINSKINKLHYDLF
jgi:hypothetical protein